jgi:translocation protein SEC66
LHESPANLRQANALAPNWGQTIFQSANEIAANTILRNRLNEIQDKTVAEKEWWEKRRASIHGDLMKEPDSTASASAAKVAPSIPRSTIDEDAVLVDGPVGSETGSMRKKKGKK